MEILYPTGVWAAILVWLSVFGAHALRMRTEKNYREAWGSATLALLPASAFWFWAVSGEADMIRRTAFLFPVGAIVGACLFSYAGYVVADIRGAKAQTGVAMANDALASALEALAGAVEKAPGVTVGAMGIATNGGMGLVGIANGPGSVGVVGIASSNGPTANGPQAVALRQAAQQARTGSISKSQINGMVAPTMIFRDAEVDAAANRATSALNASNLPN